jgi:hypothetical protein
MANYALIENGIVINTIVADSLEIAEEITGLSAIEFTEESPLGINWYWLEAANAYVVPSPYPSWTYNVEDKVWNAPTQMPIEDGKVFVWHEDSLVWTPINTSEEG